MRLDGSVLIWAGDPDPVTFLDHEQAEQLANHWNRMHEPEVSAGPALAHVQLWWADGSVTMFTDDADHAEVAAGSRKKPLEWGLMAARLEAVLRAARGATS